MKITKEGSVKIKIYDFKVPSKREPVFYNPIKEFDRMLSVKLAKKLKLKKGIDLLSGTGISGIRLMKEAGLNIVFNDINTKSTRLIKTNLKINNLTAKVFNKNANQLLYDLNEYWDFIDLDPFGTPNPYLDSAIKYTARNGILGVIATDTASLIGVKSQSCLRKYQAHIKKHPFMKETGLRTLIRHIIERGAELELAMKPIMAYYSRHYFRAYFLKDLGAKKCDELVNKIKFIYYNPKTKYRGFEPKGMEIGPIYTGDINSFSVIQEWKKEDNFPPWHFNVVELGYKEEPKMEYILKKFNGIRAHYDPKAFKTRETLFH